MSNKGALPLAHETNIPGTGRFRQARLTLPQVEARMRELAAELYCPELAELADHIPRRAAASRAPRSSVRMTPERREAIRAYVAAFPQLTQSAVATVFNCNQGRVSEALNGRPHDREKGRP